MTLLFCRERRGEEGVALCPGPSHRRARVSEHQSPEAPERHWGPPGGAVAFDGSEARDPPMEIET